MYKKPYKTLALDAPVPRAAVDLFRAGFTPLPIQPNSKRPTSNGWQRTAYRDEAGVRSAFSSLLEGGGLGVRLGRGLADVDLDAATARRAAPLLLPPTPVKSGRVSSPASHWWYKVDAAEAMYVAHTDSSRAKDEGTVVELRADTGHQTVIPPSTHPSGEPLEWVTPGVTLADAAEVDADELRAAVASVALVSILADAWPGEGSRNSAFLALAGGLLRGCADDPEMVAAAESVVRAIAALTGDDAAARVTETLRPTARKLASGNDEKVTGWTALEAVLTASQPGRVVESAKKAADALRAALGVAVALPDRDDRAAGNDGASGERKVWAGACPAHGEWGHTARACPDCLEAEAAARREVELRREVALREQLNRAANNELTPEEEAALLGRFTPLGRDEILARESVPDLLDGVIGAPGTLNMISGYRGGGKSIFTLGAAAAIATGMKEAYGLPISGGGPVLYAYLEGESHLKHRVIAWETYHGKRFEGVTIIHDPLDVRVPGDVHALTLLARRLGAKLVVLDTVAKSGGGKEDAEDFGAFRAGIESLRDGTGAAILVLHNAGEHAKGRARGHTTLIDGMDSSVVLRERADSEGGGIELSDEKSRNSAPLEKRILRIHGCGPFNPVVGRHWGAVLRLQEVEESIATMMEDRNSLLAKATHAITQAGGQIAPGELATALNIGRNNLTRRLQPLLDVGAITDNGKGSSARRYMLPDHSPQGGEENR